MKHLTRVLIIIFLSTFAFESFGQTVALKAGLNLSNMYYESDGDVLSDDFSDNLGFHAEVAAELPFGEIFALETGIGVAMKGFKLNFSETLLGEKVESTTALNTFYVDIPVNAKLIFGDDIKFYTAIGPYVGFGLSGKTKTEIEIAGQIETDETTIEWGSDENSDDFKRLDYGGRIAVGFVIQSFLIEASYKYGLANVLADTSSESVANHRVLGVSIGYRFGQN